MFDYSYWGGSAIKTIQEKLCSIIDTAIRAQRIIGSSIIVAKRGEIIFESHDGFADREAGIPVTGSTLFRLASMTKPIVCAAAMALLERRFFQLNDPVTAWLPTFTPKLPNGEKTTITLHHLLTHTAGLDYGFLAPDNEPYYSAGVSDGMDDRVLSLKENLNRIAQVPLYFVPGSAWRYSIATDVLGAVLEKVCERSLSEIVEQYITEPLGMCDTTFYVEKSDRLAQAYADSDLLGGVARLMKPHDQVFLAGCGPIHYSPGRITNPKAYPSGGAGMAGTAKDYLKFLEAVRRGGASLLNEQSVCLLTEDAVPHMVQPTADPGFGFSMGFAVLRDPKIAGRPQYAGSYEWGGVYGSKMFVDPVNELSVVILTNTALEGLMGKFPIDLMEAIYDAKYK
ncbi:MAG: hypothetical protein A2X77_05180 [Gammaproteobacteria bacterium GWE2_42_36]|nr:MAG: hypothetical protein A2X77_05180 [Gammaproteobacteria bacterium GWE2_42_36]HCU05657.1 serine hydrolase [Coxiellaceae bacterium]